MPVRRRRHRVPELIRNLHTTLNTGTDHAELLELAVCLHVHVTSMWLAHMAAPDHLVRRVAFLARRLAQDHGATTTLAVAGDRVVDMLSSREAVDLSHAHLVVREGRPGEAAAPLAAAAELAERFGPSRETDSLGFVLAPADVALHRMSIALEMDEPDQTVSVAEDVDPRRHPFALGRTQHWVRYGQALTRIGRRRNDAVLALRTAEKISPQYVLRNPFVRDTIAVLLRRSGRDAAGEELRAMAGRAGLPG
jgi:hypothetical protein